MRRSLVLLTIVSIAVLISCSLDEVAAPPVEPEFLIQDGDHGGNGHFFFLPPLVPRPAYGGTADDTLQPEVTVCELTGGTSCGPIIARFTTEPGGTLLEQVRYDRFTGSYYLVWDTRKCLAGPCALDPAKRYRLRVQECPYQCGKKGSGGSVESQRDRGVLEGDRPRASTRFMSIQSELLYAG